MAFYKQQINSFSFIALPALLEGTLSPVRRRANFHQLCVFNRRS